MGVFGLVMFETQYKKKQIGIRKVHGASILEILEMFNVKYLKIVIVCYIISAPISYLIINKWINNFAYRGSIKWEIYVFSLVLVLVITFTILTLRSLSAAFANPMN